MRKFWIIGAAVVVIGLGVALLSQQPAKAAVTKKADKEEEKKETIYNVALTGAEAKELRTYVSSSATLRADRQVDIFSKIAGQVNQLAVEEGHQVEEGDLLLALDGDDERLRLEQSRVNLEKARTEFARIEKSYQKELISTEEYDNKKYELERAQAEHEMAVYSVDLTRVTAPFSGTIVAREVEIGQTIQPSQKLFSLASLVPLEADVYLPEAQVAGLEVGMTAQIAKDNYFEKSFPGKVARVAPVVDRETGTVKVTLSVDEVPTGVRPGTYVHLRIVTDSRVAPTVIPKKGLTFDSRQNAYVYTAEPDEEDTNIYVVKKVAVQTGVEENGYISITDGLNPGEQIVLTGKESLKDGAKVRNAAENSVPIAGND